MSALHPGRRLTRSLKTAVPGPPTGFAVVGSPASDGGEFEYTDPVYIGSSALVANKIYIRTPQGSGLFSMLADPGTGSSPYLIESLTPATAYDMYVTAVNDHGESRPSNFIQITTAA